MFVRKKKNRSGTTSVVVVDKSRGSFREIVTSGLNSAEEIEQLYSQAENWIKTHSGTRDMFQGQAREIEETQLARYFLSNVENIQLNGIQLILNQVFKQIGFDAVDDDILKHLVVARISQPSSKAGTVEYLKSYFDEDVNLNEI